MSYILDALKKLEHEKSRKARSGGMINIAGSLFEDERPEPAGPVGRKVALAVVVAMVVTSGVTWLIFRPGKLHDKQVTLSGPIAPAVPAVPPPAAPAPAVSAEHATAPITPSAIAVQSPSQPVRAATRPAPPSSSVHPLKPQEASQSSVPVEDAAVLLTVQELRKRMKERKGQALPAELTIAAPADIKLSGIAWQDERRARRAVVNGFLMQEGGMVAGARITDIFQDRVRFSQSGKVFEVPLISSAAPAAGK